MSVDTTTLYICHMRPSSLWHFYVFIADTVHFWFVSPTHLSTLLLSDWVICHYVAGKLRSLGMFGMYMFMACLQMLFLTANEKCQTTVG